MVPEIAAGAAPECDDLRDACRAVVGRLVEGDPDVIAIVGAGDRTECLPPPYLGQLHRWGAAVSYPLGAGEPTPVRPLSLLIGGWLLSLHQPKCPIRLATVAPDASADECAALGARLSAGPERVALLVMGDGSACRGVAAPGYDDPRAEPYDDTVARALAAADCDALLRLDSTLSAELKVAGRPPWQGLAGAARASGTAWSGTLLRHVAPYGVAYFVAHWAAA